MRNEEVSIAFTPEDIEQALEDTFKPEHKHMAQLIVGVLEDHRGCLETVFKGTLGITPQVPYSVGDKISLDASCLSTWQWDEPTMEQEGLIKDGHLVATIVSVHIYSNDPYQIEYPYMKANKKVLKGSDKTRSLYIKGLAEEFPGDK